jgi:hypothetical protein
VSRRAIRPGRTAKKPKCRHGGVPDILHQGGEAAVVRRTHLKIAAMVVLLVIAQMVAALCLQAALKTSK